MAVQQPGDRGVWGRWIFDLLRRFTFTPLPPDSESQWVGQEVSGKVWGRIQEHWVDQLWKTGTPVCKNIFSQNYLPFWQVFKLEGSDDCYLYVRDGPDVYNWSIWSSLKGGQIYINSASAGQACPAHPTNASNVWDGYNDWRVKKKRGNASGGNDWEEGGVVVRCSVHNNWLTRQSAGQAAVKNLDAEKYFPADSDSTHPPFKLRFSHCCRFSNQTVQWCKVIVSLNWSCKLRPYLVWANIVLSVLWG